MQLYLNVLIQEIIATSFKFSQNEQNVSSIKVNVFRKLFDLVSKVHYLYKIKHYRVKTSVKNIFFKHCLIKDTGFPINNCQQNRSPNQAI